MINELTISEVQTLEQHEEVIERGLKTFKEVGYALAAIRDNRLYRESHGTFEDYCRERWGMTRRFANYQIQAASTIDNLGTIVPKPQTESQARPLTQLEPEQQREIWQEAVDTAPNGRVTAKHVQETVEKKLAHVSRASGENEWYTPPEYIEAARRVMGGIDLDPASSELANRTVNATMYYTEESDGLAWDWEGRVWMNPPYSQPHIVKFCDKFATDYMMGFITEGIVLVNNATETRWFNYLAKKATALCFPTGRIKFLDKNGNPSGAPLQGQAFLYFGNNSKKFSNEFDEFGLVFYAG